MAKKKQVLVAEALLESELLQSDYFQLKLRELFQKNKLHETKGDLETLRELAVELLQDTFTELSREGLETENLTASPNSQM